MAPPADGALMQITQDETIRPSTTVEIPAGLMPAFEAGLWSQRFPRWTLKVNAGNSALINAGASAGAAAQLRRCGWRYPGDGQRAGARGTIPFGHCCVRGDRSLRERGADLAKVNGGAT